MYDRPHLSLNLLGSREDEGLRWRGCRRLPGREGRNARTATPAPATANSGPRSREWRDVSLCVRRGVPECGCGVGEEPLAVGGSQGHGMGGDQVRGAYDEHDLRRQVLEDAVDGVEVGQVLLAHLPPLLGSEGVPHALVAVGRAVQEDERQVLEVLVDVEFLCEVMDAPAVLEDEADPEAAEVVDGLRGDRAVEAVVEQDDLVAEGRVGRGAHQQIAGVRVAVDEPVPEDHIGEEGHQVARHLRRVHSASHDLLSVVDLAAADELHDDESAGAEFWVVVGDVDVWVVLEVAFGGEGVGEFYVEVEFLNQGVGPCFVELEEVKVGGAGAVEQVVAEAGDPAEHQQVPLGLHLQEGVLHLQRHLFAAHQPPAVHLRQRR